MESVRNERVQKLYEKIHAIPSFYIAARRIVEGLL